MLPKHFKFKLFLFSFLFISIISIMFIPLSLNAVAAEELDSDNLTIKSNWLYVNEGDFINNDFEFSEYYKNFNKLKFNTGGKDLYDFENCGIVSFNDSEVLFKSTVKFGFEINAYTDVDYKDIYPWVHEDTGTMCFLTVHVFHGIWSYQWEYYDVSYDTLDKGKSLNDELYMKSHEYDGQIPITVGIQDILPPSGDISLNGISFPIPSYSYDIVQVSVDKVRNGFVGEYEDVYTNTAAVAEGSLTTQVLMTEDTSSLGASIIKAIGTWNLGWTAGPIESGVNKQNWKVDTATVGETWTTPTFDQDQPFIFGLPITLRPEVYDIVQKNTYRTASIDYDSFSGDVTSVWGSPRSVIAPERIIGIHTRNPFIHSEFVVDVTFFATVQSTPQLTEAILADPYLKRGDMVWDSSFTGDYEVTWTGLAYDPVAAFFRNILDFFTGAFSWIIWLIIGIVGVYIFIKIGVPIIQYKLIKKQRNLNRK